MLAEVGNAALLCAPFVLPVLSDDGCAVRAAEWQNASRYDLLLNMAAVGVYPYERSISPAKLQSLAHFHAFEATNSGGWSLVVDAPEPSLQSSQGVVREIKRLSGLTWENIAELIGVSTRSVHLWLSGGQMAETKRQRAGSLRSFLKFIDRGYGEANRALILDTSDAGMTVLEMLTAGEYDRAKMVVGAGQSRPSPFAPIPREARHRTAPDHLGQSLEAYGSNEIQDVEPIIAPGKRRVAARRKGAQPLS